MRIFDKLKGLRHDPKDLVWIRFLDTFFLFLIYTEVGAVLRSYQDQLSLSGRGKAGRLILSFSSLVSYPRQFKFFLN